MALLFALFVGTAAQGQERPYFFVHHPVTTADAQAQRLFDEGLTFVYGYNRRAGEDRFRQAAARDPKLAMAWWGVAYSLGPNINISMSENDAVKAYEAAAKAATLAAGASDEERALIHAIASRYQANSVGDVKRLSAAYAREMKKVAQTYPDEPDIQALYVESMLNALTFHADPRGLADEATMVKEVERDVDRWPDHIGLLHYYIHFTEPSWSEQSLRVADKLRSFSFSPELSHLLHMGSHVFIYAGQWTKVESDNKRAAEMDLAQAKADGIKPTELDYFTHNLDFWYGGSVMLADEPSARTVAKVWAPYNPNIGWIAADRFGHSGEAMRLIDESNVGATIATTHNRRTLFLYGLACADGGRADEARRAARSLGTSFGGIAADIINGRLAETQDDTARARELYRRAAAAMDRVDFETAPPWIFAPRELWAAMELRSKNTTAAVSVGEEDLKHHPHSVPILRILAKAYSAAGRPEDAARVRREIAAAMEQ